MTCYQPGRRIRGQCVTASQMRIQNRTPDDGMRVPVGIPDAVPTRRTRRFPGFVSRGVVCPTVSSDHLRRDRGMCPPQPHGGDKLGQQGFFGSSRPTEDSPVSPLTRGPNSFPLCALPDSKLIPVKLELSLCRSPTVDSCPPIPFPGTSVSSDHP